jgi:WD40 repeat protein
VASAGPTASATPTRSRSTPKIDFVNQISIERVASIENTSWGTTSIALSPDGKWLAAGKMDDKLALFDLASGKPIGQPYSLPKSGQITAVAFSAVGEHLVAGGYSGKTFVWQVSPDGRLTSEQEVFRFDSEIVALATSPTFEFFLGASRKGTVAWQPFGAIKSQPRLMQEFEKDVHAVWLPASGNEALATDGSRWVRFSLRDGEVLSSEDLGIRSARSASFSGSGKRLVIADSNTLHLVELPQVSSRRSVKLPRGEMAYGLKFHPRENWVAVGMRGKIAFYDFDRGELIAYADAESVFYQKNLDFSSDGSVLVATSDSARDSIQLFRLGNVTP